MKRLHSVFTDDMEHCYFTGSPNVDRHHIFYGNKRKLSEKYDFVIPIRKDLHHFGKEAIHDNPNKGLDLKLKKLAQTFYESNIGTRDQFREEFGKSWL